LDRVAMGCCKSTEGSKYDAKEPGAKGPDAKGAAAKAPPSTPAPPQEEKAAVAGSDAGAAPPVAVSEDAGTAVAAGPSPETVTGPTAEAVPQKQPGGPRAKRKVSTGSSKPPSVSEEKSEGKEGQPTPASTGGEGEAQKRPRGPGAASTGSEGEAQKKPRGPGTSSGRSSPDRGGGRAKSGTGAGVATVPEASSEADTGKKAGRRPSKREEPTSGPGEDAVVRRPSVGSEDGQLREGSAQAAFQKSGRRLSMNSEESMSRLDRTDRDLAVIEVRVGEIVALIESSTPRSLVTFRTELAQLESKAKQLEVKGVDDVYTSELQSGKELAKQTKKDMLRRLDILFSKLEATFAQIKAKLPG